MGDSMYQVGKIKDISKNKFAHLKINSEITIVINSLIISDQKIYLQQSNCLILVCLNKKLSS